MITEEALPTYMAMLNTLDGARVFRGGRHLCRSAACCSAAVAHTAVVQRRALCALPAAPSAGRSQVTVRHPRCARCAPAAGVRDETGASPTPWGRWTRQWVAEENRHGDLMNKYCWLRCEGCKASACWPVGTHAAGL